MNFSTPMSLGTISHLSSSQHSRRSRCLEWDCFFFRPWGCVHNHLLVEACNSRSGVQQEWSEVLSLLGDGFDSNECNSYGNKSV
jgi:hypothetical protein